MRPSRVIPVMLASGTAMLCFFYGAPALSDQEKDPQGYVDEESLWPSPFEIPVCWETNGYDDSKSIVEKIVAKKILAHTAIRLRSPWGACKQSDLGIRIRVADERPESEIGRQWIRDPVNLCEFKLDVWGRRIPKATRVLLNFKFENTYGWCRNNRIRCIEVISVHEFLHALGFLHEHLRSDASQECKRQISHGSEKSSCTRRPISNYDPDSIMNYCKSMFSNDVKLSDGDLSTLEFAYAKR